MRKRSSFFILAAVALLAALAVYLKFSDRSSTTAAEPDRQFGYRDTASIDRIFIADKEGNSSNIVKTEKGWVVNGKYTCRREGMLNLLEVIRNVEVKMPVPRKSQESVIRIMSAASEKVEIYAHGEKVKVYYVGHETEDGEGSYMLLSDPETGKNYNAPYVCFIPGFKGYLLPRYIAKEQDWRDRLVVNFIPPEMHSVQLEYASQPDSSFTIELQSTTQFLVKNAKGKVLDFDQDRVKQYLGYLQNLSYEVLMNPAKDPELIDSLREVGPFVTLRVNGNAFSATAFRFYRKKAASNVVPQTGEHYSFDPDRMYMSFEGDREWAICQYFVFGKLLQTSAYFQRRNPVKK